MAAIPVGAVGEGRKRAGECPRALARHSERRVAIYRLRLRRFRSKAGAKLQNK